MAAQMEMLDDRRAELHAAFLAFGSVSEQLSGAFDSLRAEVARLRLQLQEAQAGSADLASRLAALVNGIPGGVLLLDALGDIRECNPGAIDLLGEPLLGQSFAAVLARAALDTAGAVEHTKLRNGRFVNISRRHSSCYGEGVLATDITEPRP